MIEIIKHYVGYFLQRVPALDPEIWQMIIW